MRLLIIIAILCIGSEAFAQAGGPGVGANQGLIAPPAPASASGTVPPGSPPQFVGYSAANVPEAETLGADCTLVRTGANAYGISCPIGNGNTSLFTFGLSDMINGTGTAIFPTTIVAGMIPVIRDATSTDNIQLIADAATGQVFKSGGVGAIPIWGTSPVMLAGGSNTTVDNANPNVWPAQGTGAPVATTSEGTVAVDVQGSTAKNLLCILLNAAGTPSAAGGTNYVLALRQNLSTTTLTCTITAGNNNCTDASHTVALTGRDRVDFIDTPSGTPNALIPKCSVLLF